MKIALLCLRTGREKSCVWVLDHQCAEMKLLNKSPPPSSRQMRFLSGSWLCSGPSLQGDLTLDSVEQPRGNTENLEFLDRFLSLQKTSILAVFLLRFPSVPHGSGVFWKRPALRCPDTRVPGGVLSCRGAVRLTVTQLTDSQTTHDLRCEDFILFSTCQMIFSSSSQPPMHSVIWQVLAPHSVDSADNPDRPLT